VMSDGKQKRQTEGSIETRGSQKVDRPIVYHRPKPKHPAASCTFYTNYLTL